MENEKLELKKKLDRVLEEVKDLKEREKVMVKEKESLIRLTCDLGLDSNSRLQVEKENKQIKEENTNLKVYNNQI